MRAWFEEAWAIYRYHIPRVLGNGRMALFFVACAICLPIAVRKSGEKNLRNYCVVSALYALLLLNPVLAPLYNACLGGNWWRIFWFLGIPALAAACAALLTELPRPVAPKVLIALGLAALIVFCGNFQYNPAVFQKTENLYRVPQDVIEICDIVHEQVEKPKLASPGEVCFRVRQYDATIRITNSRDNLGDKKLAALLNPEGEYDLSALCERALKKNCNCVALREDKLPPGAAEGTEELMLLGVTGPAHYHVYYLREATRGGLR